MKTLIFFISVFGIYAHADSLSDLRSGFSSAHTPNEAELRLDQAWDCSEISAVQGLMSDHLLLKLSKVNGVIEFLEGIVTNNPELPAQFQSKKEGLVSTMKSEFPNLFEHVLVLRVDASGSLLGEVLFKVKSKTLNDQYYKDNGLTPAISYPNSIANSYYTCHR